MSKKSFNEKAINDVYKNAHIALQSINDILPAVTFKDLKDELKQERKGYQSVLDDISVYMKNKGIKREDINPIKKLMLKTSVKLKTLTDKSKNNISEMMIKGTVMGIIELAAMKNECVHFDDETTQLINKLMNLEENYEQKLKAYL